jgi:hypothetical protein
MNFKIYHFYKVLNQTLILEMKQVHELGKKILVFSVLLMKLKHRNHLRLLENVKNVDTSKHTVNSTL